MPADVGVIEAKRGDPFDAKFRIGGATPVSERVFLSELRRHPDDATSVDFEITAEDGEVDTDDEGYAIVIIHLDDTATTALSGRFGFDLTMSIDGDPAITIAAGLIDFKKDYTR